MHHIYGSSGEITPELIVTQSGDYTLTVTIEGCEVTSNAISVILQDQPIVVITSDGADETGNVIVKCAGETITLTAIVTEADPDAVTYTWFLDGGEIPGNTNTIEVEERGLYQVEVNGNGCIDTDDIDVQFYANENCIITQGISPNRDGLNDNLDLEFLNADPGIEKLSIFNRHGLLVYERENYVNEWSGQTNDDTELPVGNYYYVINLVEGEPINGFIYLNK